MAKMTNDEMMEQMFNVYGAEKMMDKIRQFDEERREKEKKYKKLISPYEYSNTGRQKNNQKIEYPDWVDEILDRVTKETGVGLWGFGSGESKSMKITYKDFARYIIHECNDNGITLGMVLEVLKAAPAWNTGYGISRFRMELVFHILMLHKNNLSKVKESLIEMLKKYDQTSLKVFANADDAYRYILDHEIQMISYAEKYVCEKTGEAPQFEAA